MTPVFLRAGNNYDTNQASQEAGLECQDKSLAQQQFAEECDINTIVRRFGITGELPTNVRMPTYGDFTGLQDFHQAMNAVRSAGESFMSMPAHIRARFGNDPGKFVDFCSHEENRQEAIKLGLVLPKAADLAARQEPVNGSQGDPAPGGAAPQPSSPT